jgi:NhaP-type Na+/H+ and K+/H+ antiporter
VCTRKAPFVVFVSVVIQIWLVGEAIKLSATALVIPVMATKLGETKKSIHKDYTHSLFPFEASCWTTQFVGYYIN